MISLYNVHESVHIVIKKIKQTKTNKKKDKKENTYLV